MKPNQKYDLWIKGHAGRWWQVWADEHVWTALGAQPWVDWFSKEQHFVYVDPRFDILACWEALRDELELEAVFIDAASNREG